MRFLPHAPVSIWLAVLGLACSSKSSSNDGGKGNEDGSPALDGPRYADARDSIASESGGGRDVRDARSATDARDVRAGDTADSAVVDSSRIADGKQDGKADGKRDGKLDSKPDSSLDGNLDTGPVVGTCASPIEIPNYLSHVELTASTSNAEHILDFPCTANGGDVVFVLESNTPEIAYADTFGATFNTALFFSETCERPTPPAGEGMMVCNDDACGTSQSQAIAALAYGRHYLIVSGASGESGDVKIHFQHAPIGNGPLVMLPPGTASVSGTTGGIDSTRTCDTSGPKNSYWWTYCPSDVGGSFQASTCLGATWDTSLFLQIPQTDTLSCTDDDPACGMQTTLEAPIPAGAGMFVLTVGGTLLSHFGAYTLAYTRP